MPQEKTPTIRSNPGKPLKPVLASNRTARSPITPRLANSSTPTLASGTSTRSTVNGITRAHTFSPDSLGTPTSSSVVSNVTPRSNLRKSRVDSAGSTPTGTLSPAPYIVEGGRRSGGTLSPVPPTQARRPASVLGVPSSTRSPLLRSQTFGAPTATRKSLTIGVGSDHAGPTFFRADDRRSPDKGAVVKKPAVFFHANGDAEAGGRQAQASPSPPLSAVSGKSGKSQFFHANGLAEDADVPPLPPMPNLTKVKVPQLSPPPNSRQPSMFFQPLSPGSGNIHLSYRKGASQIIRPGQLSPGQLSPTLSSAPAPLSGPAPTAVSSMITTSVLGSVSNKNHRRASSLSSIDSTSTGKGSIRNPQSVKTLVAAVSSPPSAITPNREQSQILNNEGYAGGYFGLGIDAALSNAVDTEQAAPPIPEIESTLHRRGLSTESVPQSPIKANLGPSDVEMANNARRERKVMDLEISNSSLLAINRQLEKEVRRQKAELRRFRRLSRVGRLSSLPENLIPGAIDEDGAVVNGQTSLEPLDEEDELSDADDASSISSDEDEGNMTPETLAAHDAKRIARDSKRLQLDLAKHRELLVDSQKMNQSLRRCMAWTEEMLREGKKQLDHRVRVSDVKLGGRILDPLDELDPVDELDEQGIDLEASEAPSKDVEPELGAEDCDEDDMVQLIAQLEAMTGGTIGGDVPITFDQQHEPDHVELPGNNSLR